MKAMSKTQLDRLLAKANRAAQRWQAQRDAERNNATTYARRHARRLPDTGEGETLPQYEERTRVNTMHLRRAD